MNDQEKHVLKRLNHLLRQPHVTQQIDAIADRVEQNFAESNDGLAWETVPLEIYGKDLPEFIRSSWVFILRKGSASGAERHPNSHQRVRSWRRGGDFQVRTGDEWESHDLKNDFDLPIEQQWASIPVNTWHQAVVPSTGHWVVVSFHTVDAEELIEEREEATELRQRTYTRAHS